MSDPLAWIEQELAGLREQDLLRSLLIRESPPVGGRVQIAGRQFVNFGSNDYLGLASDSRLVDAVKKHTGYVGWGSGASPLIHGRGTLHARLEKDLAEFEQTEAALLFPTGFAANQGTLPALAGPDDVIFSDQYNHASLIDGCRLSRARVLVYRHRDVQHLRSLLEEATGFRRRLIVTDSLFSMDGDLAPLVELAELADRHAAMLVVDEAHATGVFGKNGRGVAEHLGVKERVDVLLGTLSKALGCHGGFVAGKQILIDWLVNSARSFIFSTAPPDAACIAAVTALDIVQKEPQRREELQNAAKKLGVALRDAGFDTGTSCSQIIPVILKDNLLTMSVKQRLMEDGYFVPGIRPPAVATGRSLLRISLNIGHTEEMIDGLLSSLKQAVTAAEV